MKPRSAKNKGQRAAKQVKEMLLEYAPELEAEDILVVPSGVPGEDLKLSPLARRRYPMSFEVKNQESISIWACIKQAESNAGDHIPVLSFTRNNHDMYACLKMTDLLRILKESA